MLGEPQKDICSVEWSEVMVHNKPVVLFKRFLYKIHFLIAKQIFKQKTF